MPLRIYAPKSDADLPNPQMFFDINGQDYDMFYSPVGNVDILLTNHSLQGHHPSKIKVSLEIWHNYENQFDKLLSKLENTDNNFYIITNVYKSDESDNSNIIFNDFLFNRTKAYYLQFPFRLDTTKWYFSNQLGYIIPDNFLAENKRKIYIAPNKNHLGRTIKFRPQIAQLLESNYKNLGYVGNITDDPSLVLHPHDNWPFYSSIEAVENISVQPAGIAGYSPPHNEYYKNTFISIYAETIEWGKTIAVTEKTYDPLIKGHFILPFSSCGFVSYLESLGFVLPKFIDYSYDTISDDEIRFQKYRDEIHRLLSISLNDWRMYWTENLKILRHNQLIFHEKSYDRIDFMKLIGDR